MCYILFAYCQHDQLSIGKNYVDVFYIITITTTTTTTLRGSREVLYKRLKTRLRQECICAEPSAPWDLKNQVQVNPYSLDYLCVLDFEATCEEPNPPDYIHEVIEFPVVLLNLKTLEVVSD